MESHIIEFSCQYTDQIRKKHKIWHDGKLKFYELNNRFQLFAEEDGIQLCSCFVTKQKDVDFILDSTGFNSEEHKLGGQYLVIIDEKIAKYKREVQVQLRNVSSSGSGTSNKKNISKPKDSLHNKSIEPKTIIYQKQNEKIKITKNSNDDIKRRVVGADPLALKFNKPFRTPRVSKLYTDEKNRPTIRNARQIDVKSDDRSRAPKYSGTSNVKVESQYSVGKKTSNDKSEARTTEANLTNGVTSNNTVVKNMEKQDSTGTSNSNNDVVDHTVIKSGLIIQDIKDTEDKISENPAGLTGIPIVDNQILQKDTDLNVNKKKSSKRIIKRDRIRKIKHKPIEL